MGASCDLKGTTGKDSRMVQVAVAWGSIVEKGMAKIKKCRFFAFLWKLEVAVFGLF